MRTVVADACLVAGAGLVVFGVWLIYPPAACLVAGLALIGIGARLYGAV